MIKRELYNIIFKSDSKKGKIFDIVLLILILLSVLNVMLESVESINNKHNFIIRLLEWIFTAIFTIEYFLRIYSIKIKKSYIFSFYGVIDLISFLPSYFSFFIPGLNSLKVLRTVRFIRIFRILKLSRYLEEVYYLKKALIKSRSKILVFLTIIFSIVTILGTFMYIIEGSENGFSNIPVSIYWAIVTLTTVGYGDISPQTPLGQFLSSIIMILGYAIIVVPTGIFSAELISEQKENKELMCPECKTKFRV